MNSYLTSLRTVWCLWLSSVLAVDLALVTGGWFGGEWVGGGLEAACGELSGTVNSHLEPQLPVCLADEFTQFFMRAYCLSWILSLWFNIAFSWFARRIKDWHMGFYWPKKLQFIWFNTWVISSAEATAQLPKATNMFGMIAGCDW